jgi:hypothetical protein
MSEQEFDDVYTRLCYALTDVGEAHTPAVLARLVLLLMKQVDDAAAISAAIDSALEGSQTA